MSLDLVLSVFEQGGIGSESVKWLRGCEYGIVVSCVSLFLSKVSVLERENDLIRIYFGYFHRNSSFYLVPAIPLH